MLIIERKAKEFPPDGRIPVDDTTMLEKLAKEVAEVALYDPALEDMPLRTLAKWIEDPKEKYTFTYLTDAVRAAQQVQQDARRTEPVPSSRPVQKLSTVEQMLQARNDPAVRARKEALALQNCGKTSGVILVAIDPKQEKLDKQLAKKETYYGQADVERLRALLNKVPDAGQVLVLDCTLVSDHSFLLEIHPDGRRYLFQSYQGVYSLHWWTGMEDDKGLFFTHADKREQSRFETDLARVMRARDDYGKGQPIAEAAWNRFVTAMVEAHRTGRHDALAAQWTTLPFAPTDVQAATLAQWMSEPKVRVIEFLFTGLPDNPHSSVAGAAIPPKQ
jgi:hypothetical protein